MSRRLKAGIAGCGQIAGGYVSRDGAVLTHAAAYRADPRFDLIACAEPDAARLSDFRTRWGVPAGYATLAEMLAAHPDLDVVSLCSPTAAHAADLDTLVASSVPAVFCEKPIAADLADATRLVDGFEAAGRILVVNHTRRFVPQFRDLAARLAGGELGRLRAIQGNYTGGILNNGTHWIDLAHMLAGPLALLQVTGARADRSADDPTVDATLRTEGGATVHLTGGDAGDFALFEMRLITEKAVIDIEERGFLVRERRPEPDPRFPGFKKLSPGSEMVTDLHQSLAFALQTVHQALAGAPPPSTGRTALQAQTLCEAMRREALALLARSV